MNYFDFVSRGTSWDLLDAPLNLEGIEVTEQPLTDEEIEQWTKTVNEHSRRSSSSGASPPL